MICQDGSSWKCPMDQIEQNLKADELTRNRFVERAVEAYQASAQNTNENVRNNHENDQVTQAQTVSEGQQSADGGQSNRMIADLQTTLRDRNVNQQAVEPHHQSDHDQQSNRILPELQLAFNSRAQTDLRVRRIQVIRRNLNSNETHAQQSVSTEPIEHVSRRVFTRPPRPQVPPKPEVLNMRSALEKFRQMEIQNEPNHITNSFHRSNRRTRSEDNSLPRPNRPIPPLIAELQTTLRQRNSIPPRAFDTIQRPPNAEEEDSLNVDTSDPLNQSLMVDIDDAESIGHLVELGFDESDATTAFFAAERNLEDAIESLLEQNASN